MMELTEELVMAILGPEDENFRPDLFVKLTRREQVELRNAVARESEPAAVMVVHWMDRLIAEQDGQLN